MPPKPQLKYSPLQGRESVQSRGGCAKGAHLLHTAPDQLIGQNIETYTQQTKQTRYGTIKEYDAQKGTHLVQTDGETMLVLKLSECHWRITQTPMEVVKAHQQDNNGTMTTGASEQVDQEEEGKGRRKRRPSTRQDQVMNDRLGSVQAKGRRPYKPGGCKHGKLLKNESLVGLRILIWSQQDSQYYAAGVKDYNSQKKVHTIEYVNGSLESLDMKMEIWRIPTNEHKNVYPKNFFVTPPTEEGRETRRRKGNSGQVQAVTPTKAVEGLLALASSGSGAALPSSGVMGAPGAAGGDGPGATGGAGGSREVQHIENGGQGLPGAGIPPNRPSKGHDQSGGTGGTGGPGDRPGEPGQKPPNPLGVEGSRKLVASSLEFQVHKVEHPDNGYHVLCSVPPGTRISDVHVTCGNACIIIEHGRNSTAQPNVQSTNNSPSGCSRLVILLPEPIRPASASAKLTQGGKLAVFTALASV